MKKLFILALLFFVLGFLLDCWKTDGTCDQVEKVSFRGIHFQFPLKVSGAWKTPMSGFSRNYTWLQTDSIGGQNISGKWFFERDYEWNGQQQINETVKNKLIYGVAFQLYEDSCKTDQEVITELQKTYPGDYEYFEKYGLSHYRWDQDCLTIFVKRTYHESGVSVPEVSFCYGLSFLQTSMYGDYTGYINNFPD